MSIEAKVAGDFEEFPSPYGDELFLMKNPAAHKVNFLFVSVPLRGFVVFNVKKFCNQLKEVLFPSPYGDLLFLIKGSPRADKGQTEFPSPCGD